MSDIFSRTQLIFGEEAMEILANSRVAVFGVGGVGGFTVEALARSGVGAIDLIDDDKVCVTNINRQIIALGSTVGMYKVDAAEKRIHDINPQCRVTCHKMFYMPETADKLDFSQYDYVVDAIDTVTGKIEIILQAKAAGVPVISSMGAGNKVDPTAFEVASGKSHALSAETPRREKAEGGLLKGTANCPSGKSRRGRLRQYRYENRHRKTLHSRVQRFCPLCGRTHHRRRGHKRPYQTKKQ